MLFPDTVARLHWVTSFFPFGQQGAGFLLLPLSGACVLFAGLGKGVVLLPIPNVSSGLGVTKGGPGSSRVPRERERELVRETDLSISEHSAGPHSRAVLNRIEN